MKEFWKQISCYHKFKVVKHFQDESFSPFSLVECEHCQKRDKIDDYEGQDWWQGDGSVEHPIIKTWIRHRISIEGVINTLKRDLIPGDRLN